MMILPFFKKKKIEGHINDSKQQYIEAFNKMVSEFKIGDTCYCNGCDLISGIFMHADKGIIRNFHESSLKCDVYLVEKDETVRVLPELVFHTKEEALEERRLYRLQQKEKNIKRIKEIQGTTISEFVTKHGLQSSIFSRIYPPLQNFGDFDYHAIEVFFGNVDNFVLAYFAFPNITKENNLVKFEKQFESYCNENGYSFDCVSDVSIFDMSNDYEELQELVNLKNLQIKEDKEDIERE